MRNRSLPPIKSLRRIRLLSRLCFVAAAFLTGCAGSNHPESAPPQCFHRNAELERSIGFCQAVRTGDTLHISGSVGAGEMPEAIQQAYDELRETLAAQGLDFSNVVKETVFTTDLDAFVGANAVRKAYYGDHRPAASWIGVQRLYLPEYVVEVELVARYPQ